MYSLLIAACLISANDSFSWPQFRGIPVESKRLPTEWSEDKNIGWQTTLPGYGQSCPVVWKDKVFVTAVDGKEREKGFVAAYDAETGKQLWQHEFETTQKAKWSTAISRAAPTPAVDAGGVYAFFEGGNLLALSHDGKPLWSRSLVKEYGEFKNNHGLAASLAQSKDALYVLVDHKGPSYLLAVDKKNGKNLWKTDRKERNSWTSPVVWDHNGKSEIVVSSGGGLAAYDAKTGDLLWDKEGLSGNTIPSAAVSGDLVIVGASAGREGQAKPGVKSNSCYKVATKDGKPSADILWTADKATSSYASPLVHRGHVYFVNQVGVVFCLDLETGKEVYSERIDGPCWCSPVAAGDYVYFFCKNGQTTILKAGGKFEKVASNRLWDPDKLPKPEAKPEEKKEEPKKKEGDDKKGRGEHRPPANIDPLVYGVAAADNAFFVRTGTTLYRIGKAK